MKVADVAGTELKFLDTCFSSRTATVCLRPWSVVILIYFELYGIAVC